MSAFFNGFKGFIYEPLNSEAKNPKYDSSSCWNCADVGLTSAVRHWADIGNPTLARRRHNVVYHNCFQRQTFATDSVETPNVWLAVACDHFERCICTINYVLYEIYMVLITGSRLVCKFRYCRWPICRLLQLWTAAKRCVDNGTDFTALGQSCGV